MRREQPVAEARQEIGDGLRARLLLLHHRRPQLDKQGGLVTRHCLPSAAQRMFLEALHVQNQPVEPRQIPALAERIERRHAHRAVGGAPQPRMTGVLGRIDDLGPPRSVRQAQRVNLHHVLEAVAVAVPAQQVLIDKSETARIVGFLQPLATFRSKFMYSNWGYGPRG